MENSNEIISINSNDISFDFLNSKPVGTVFKIKNTNGIIKYGILAFKNYDGKEIGGLCLMIKDIMKNNQLQYYINPKLRRAQTIQIKEHQYSKNKELVAKASISYKYQGRHEEIFKNIRYSDLLEDKENQIYSAKPIENKNMIDIQSEISIVIKYKDEDGVILVYQKSTKSYNYYNFEDWMEWVKFPETE